MIVVPQMRGILKSASLVTDPNFSSVVQLAHFNGTNGSTTFTNSCPHGNTMGALGAAALSTTQSKFGGASLRTSGSTNNYAIGASTADYNFSTGDWCIEFWFRPDANGNYVIYEGRNSTVTAQWVPTIYSNGSGDIRFFSNGADRITSATGVVTAAAWNYVKCNRVSGVTKLWVGSSQVGSNFTDANTYVQCVVILGAAGNGASACAAYFDDLRVTKGAGRASTDGTVPTAAFPNS